MKLGRHLDGLVAVVEGVRAFAGEYWLWGLRCPPHISTDVGTPAHLSGQAHQAIRYLRSV